MDSVTKLGVAEEAARAAGDVIIRYWRDGVTMRGKQSFNLVSDADLEAERAIAATIRRHFPQHAILGEELHADDVTAEHLWIVDPLDGTNNFAHRVPQFAVSVAYYEQGQPICGAIFDPLHETMYTARRGGGAFCNGRPVAVATNQRLDEALVGVGFYYDRGRIMEATLAAIGDFFRQQIHGIRRFGAASLDLCWVGMGLFGAFFEYELAPWDFAAGRLFVEEAGGRVTTCLGDALPIAKTSLLASNGALHNAAIEITRRHLPVRD